MIRVSQSKTQDEYRRQFFFISLVVVFSFLVLIARLWYLQILNGEKWLRFSESNRIEAKRIPAIRGRILDRDGKVIADSKPSFDLKVVPGQLQPSIEGGIRRIQKLLNWPEKETALAIKKTMVQNKHDNFTIKRDITRDEMAIILGHQFSLTGVKIEVIPSRKYLYGSLGSHLIGYLGEIGKKDLQIMKEQDSEEYGLGEFWGLSGVEKKYEAVLKGLDGIEPVIEDVWGRQIRVDSVGGLLPSFQARPDKEGLDLVLTVDLDLQIIAEKMLEGKKGSVIALDPRSGEILAMTSSPTYEPEKFVRGVESSYWRKMIFDPEKPLYNRSIQGVYPPASTFKAIMVAAILQEHVANPNERVYCPGHYRIGREVKNCWKHEGHGYMNLKEALQHSCDVYFYEMSRRLGVDKIAQYARDFGLGEKTGYPLSPPEEKGLVPTQEWKKKVFKQPWVEGETLSVAIGQGFLSATPLQMAIAYAAIANGGTLVHPYPAIRTQTYEGKIIENFAGSENRKISIDKENIQKTMEALSSVVNEPGGTAYGTVRSKIVKIAGKTGTAQVSGRKSGVKTKDHAWFIGYAPADDDPEILVAAVVEEGLHGSSAAGPIAKNIIEQYFNDKNIAEGIIPEEIVPPVIEKKIAPIIQKPAEPIMSEEPNASVEKIPLEIHPEEVQEENISSEPLPVPTESDEVN
jgi:penicillin-binding protein 2